jgi:hypothetical protein
METFLTRIGEMIEKIIDRKLSSPTNLNNSTIRFGTVTNATGRPQILLDGDDTPSGKRYPYLSSYVPAIGDRVLLIRDNGGTWIVAGKLQDAAAPSPWTNLALGSGVGSVETGQYMRDSSGIVRLRGRLNAGSLANGGLIFTLPVGFRPGVQTVFMSQCQNGVTYEHVEIVMLSDGNNLLYGQPNPANYINLSHITFLAEA